MRVSKLLPDRMHQTMRIQTPVPEQKKFWHSAAENGKKAAFSGTTQ